MPPPDTTSGVPLRAILRRNVAAMEARRAEHLSSTGVQERLAERITRFTGSMTFVYLHLAVYGAWVVLNLGLIPGMKPFDPTFVILASEASVEAIFLSTFVLISQNRMAALADRRADLDLHINLLAEHELTRLARVLDAMARHMGVDPDLIEGMTTVQEDIAPEAVMDEIERDNPEAT
ncbi:MAG: DUF1003 domain-containing protein [Sphingobium sp.]